MRVEGVFCRVDVECSVSTVGERESSSIRDVFECAERDRDLVDTDGFGGLRANGM